MNYHHRLMVIRCHYKPIQMDKAVAIETIRHVDVYYTLLSLIVDSVLTLSSQNSPKNGSTQTHCSSVSFTVIHVPLLKQGDGRQGTTNIY